MIFNDPRIDELTECDERFNAGARSFKRSRHPLFASAGCLIGGDTPEDVQVDYGLTDLELSVVVDNARALADEYTRKDNE